MLFKRVTGEMNISRHVIRPIDKKNGSRNCRNHGTPFYSVMSGCGRLPTHTLAEKIEKKNYLSTARERLNTFGLKKGFKYIVIL